MKVIVFDDVLCTRAGDYAVADLAIAFHPHADDAVAIVAAERPDVVLMDYSMAEHQSGEEAVRALRAGHGRDLRIVAISSDERSNERMLAAGADDALPKTHVKAYLSRLASGKSRGPRP